MLIYLIVLIIRMMIMKAKEKANEMFELIVKKKKTLTEMPLHCCSGETGVLLYLNFVNNCVTASELSKTLMVSMPRVTSILNTLETKKLILKKTDSKDKRKITVIITDLGKEIISIKKEEIIDQMAYIIERLEEREVDEFMRIIDKIGSIIEDYK